MDLDTVCCCWAAWLIARACDGETMGVFGRFSRDHRNHIVDQLQSMFALPLSTLDLGSPAGVKWGRGRVTFWHVLASPELLVGRQLLSGEGTQVVDAPDARHHPEGVHVAHGAQLAVLRPRLRPAAVRTPARACQPDLSQVLVRSPTLTH